MNMSYFNQLNLNDILNTDLNLILMNSTYHLPIQSENLKQKSFSCQYCSRSFSRKYDLTRHQRIHTGLKPYSCHCCHQAFARSDARVRHFRKVPACQIGPQLLNCFKKK